MAQMFPRDPDDNAPDSEKRVFARFRDALPSDWKVIHARRFFFPARSPRGAVEGEVDFLVLDPARGYLGLEVKGGTEIGRDADGWYSVSQLGKRSGIADPGKQAQNAVHQISDYLSQQSQFRGNRRPSFGWGVVLPDFDVNGDLDPALPEALIVDRRDLLDTKKAIDRVFAANGVNGPELGNDAARAFVEVLAPGLRLVRPLSARIEAETQVLHRLTEEQTRLIEHFEDRIRVAVEGPAGTGKTLVAMERARRLAEAGQRVLLLCYNGPLGDFLAPRAHGFTVSTFHALCKSMARSAGLRFQPPREDAGEFWDTQAPELLLEALEAYPDERFDAVIVDEGQDFRDLWWIPVEKLLRDPRTSSLWVFFDSHQNIFGGGPTDNLRLERLPLLYNCRNTQKIAQHASASVGIVPKFRPNTPEGVEVETIDCPNDAAMIDAVRITLHRLVREGHLQPDQVIVMSPRAPANSVVFRARKLGNIQLVEFLQKWPGPNEVAFTTLQRFKGLEADAVILCEVAKNNPMCSSNHLYVAMSRARHVLVVARYAA